MLLAYADFVTPSQIGMYSSFLELVRDEGITAKHLTLAANSGQELLDEWEEMIDLAQILIIRGTNLPVGDSFARRVLERIDNGVSALVYVDPNTIDAANTFLGRFGMTAEDLRVRNEVPWGEDVYTVSFRREDGCFRNLDLFAGVDELIVGSPGVVWAYDESMSLLSASDNQMVLTPHDLRASWKARECPCLAGWRGPRNQAVIAMPGSFLRDPSTSVSGCRFPGIEPNLRFAQNLLRYLISGTIDGGSLGDRIEVELCDFVIGAMKSANNEGWWEASVPAKAREKCAKRQEEGKSVCPVEAFLDLIDLKVIIERNWTLFGPYYQQIGIDNKKDAIGWINNFNISYRRMAAHPLKRRLSNFEYSTRDLELISGYLDLCRRLRKLTTGGVFEPTPG